MKSSKSVPNIDTNLRRRGRDENNSEPGVVSSSSSLSSSGSSNLSGLRSVGLSSKENNSKGSCSSLTRSEDALSDLGTPKQKPSAEAIERTKLMLQGAKKFNMDPKKGIDFLVLNGLIQKTPEEVAQVRWGCW